MKIALAQMSIIQADFDKNLQKISEVAAKSAKNGADLVVFPEMAVCGFNYAKNKEALSSGRDFEKEILEVSKQNKIAIAAGLPFLERKNFAENSQKNIENLPKNRLILTNKFGEKIAFYDKIHLFGGFNEAKYVGRGERICVVKTEFAKIGLSICYDLRFSEMYSPMAENGAELIIVAAAWPYPRMEQFKTLIRARAIENQCFVLAVNQAGSETFGSTTINYGGASALIDPFGETLAQCARDVEDYQIAEADFSLVEKARHQITALADKRKEVYKNIKIF